MKTLKTYMTVTEIREWASRFAEQSPGHSNDDVHEFAQMASGYLVGLAMEVEEREGKITALVSVIEDRPTHMRWVVRQHAAALAETMAANIHEMSNQAFEMCAIELNRMLAIVGHVGRQPLGELWGAAELRLRALAADLRDDARWAETKPPVAALLAEQKAVTALLRAAGYRYADDTFPDLRAAAIRMLTEQLAGHVEDVDARVKALVDGIVNAAEHPRVAVETWITPLVAENARLRAALAAKGST